MQHISGETDGTVGAGQRPFKAATKRNTEAKELSREQVGGLGNELTSSLDVLWTEQFQRLRDDNA